MTTEVKRLIRVRTDKGAEFKRDGFGKKRQLSASWRKPRGQHNKQREQKKAKGALPKPGFGSPVAVRGMHPSGFFDMLVFTSQDLEVLDPKTQAVRISATVGTRKRLALQEKAISLGLKVLNVRVAKETAKPEPVPEPEEEKPEVKEEEKPKPVKKAPAKKAAPKKTENKPVGEPAEKPAKTPKAKVSKTEKPVKKEAKSAAAPEPETTEEESKPKSKPKKKASSGVKKNE